MNLNCDVITGSSSAQPKDTPKEAPSKSSGSSSRGPDKKFEFSFNLAKYVHYADFYYIIIIKFSHFLIQLLACTRILH